MKGLDHTYLIQQGKNAERISLNQIKAVLVILVVYEWPLQAFSCIFFLKEEGRGYSAAEGTRAQNSVPWAADPGPVWGVNPSSALRSTPSLRKNNSHEAILPQVAFGCDQNLLEQFVWGFGNPMDLSEWAEGCFREQTKATVTQSLSRLCWDFPWRTRNKQNSFLALGHSPKPAFVCQTSLTGLHLKQSLIWKEVQRYWLE